MAGVAAAIFTGLLIGVWIALIFALRPLLALRRVSPLATLRRDAETMGLARRRDWLSWLLAQRDWQGQAVPPRMLSEIRHEHARLMLVRELAGELGTEVAWHTGSVPQARRRHRPPQARASTTT